METLNKPRKNEVQPNREVSRIVLELIKYIDSLPEGTFEEKADKVEILQQISIISNQRLTKIFESLSV